MKILFIIDQVYMHGGIERVLSIKANFFAENPTNKIFIITTEQKDKSPCYEFSNNITFKDLKINYNRTKSYFHPINFIKIPKHISKLSTFIKKTSPDVIIVCSHSTDTYFIPFINKSIPKIKEFHYSKFIEKNKRENPGNLLKKWFLSFADYVESKYDKLIVLNKDEASYYKTNNIEIIPNPLTFSTSKPSKKETKIAITAGRIAPVKGYDLLIDIWELVAKKNTEWQLHIYGEGEKKYVEELQQKIISKKLESLVFLKGKTNNVQQKMLDSSFFVMTSHNECFPLVLLEAQACGLPIIAYNCPHGPRNIITKDTGYLIDLYDKNQYSKVLIQLMGDSEKRKKMGLNALKNVEKYNTELIMTLWLKMLESLIKMK